MPAATVFAGNVGVVVGDDDGAVQETARTTVTRKSIVPRTTNFLNSYLPFCEISIIMCKTQDVVIRIFTLYMRLAARRNR